MSEESPHLPLVAFTSLAMAGAGAIAADAFAALNGYVPQPAVTAAGCVLLAAGLLVSLTHLGRPARFPLAAARFGRSRLSTEVVLGPLTLACGALSLAATFGSLPGPYVYPAASILAGSFLVMVGVVYRLGGQLTWTGAAVLTPVSGGLVVGMVGVEALAPGPHVVPLAIVLILFDAVVFMLRWRKVTSLALAGHDGVSHWFEHRHELLLGRFLLVDAIPFVLLTLSPSLVAPTVAAAGLVLDRFAFYALGVQHTTEREISSVEDAIARAPSPHDR
jgi:DMSO reductase anchor subunit